MKKKTMIRKGAYFDSVKLMLVTNALSLIDGVIDVSVVMGTELNKESLRRMELLTDEAKDAAVTDLIIAVNAESDETISVVLKKLDEELNSTESQKSENNQIPRSIKSAIEVQKDSNLCIVSVPGRYAKSVALDALKNNLHVMLFSDNVSLEDELELKKVAVEKNLLMMGPDCGTALINCIPLCFSNKVKEGTIGIVAASGTGAQEVMTLIDLYGGGLTQVIGTGGRDLSETIDGRMMFLALEALNADTKTKIITVISKPPSDVVKEKMLNYIRNNIKKPVVINFLGAKFDKTQEGNLYFASTLDETARTAVRIAGYNSDFEKFDREDAKEILKEKIKNILASDRKYIRGLYSGGTLAYESLFTMEESLGTVYSNLSKKNKVKDVFNMEMDATVDFGEDEFTNGRPHPMIDTTLRHEVFEKTLSQKDVAVILMDIVIGYGSHSAPHKVFIETYKKHLSNGGDYIPVVVSICGTKQDPQNYDLVKMELEEANFIVMNSNYSAVKTAVEIAEVIRGKK